MNAFTNNLSSAGVQSVVLTENGALTFDTSKSAVVDFFFAIGASRGRSLIGEFNRALAEDQDMTLRILFHGRDVRGGMGERQTFRDLLNALDATHPDIVEKLIPLIPVYGRWDDLFALNRQSRNYNNALKFYASVLLNPLENLDTVGLAAKWSPREKSANSAIMRDLCKVMNMNAKQYRKLVSALSSTVEQNMCAKDWAKIVYEHVPSVAMARYRKSFGKHDNDRFVEFLSKVQSGEKTMNASAVFPHDVLRDIIRANPTTISAINTQWNALPNYIGENTGILPISDVSGSMGVSVSGSVTALDVSVALGLYCAERQSGAFKDIWMNFSVRPKLMKLTGDNIVSKYNGLDRGDWSMNTNFEAAFKLILNHAKANNVPAYDMPKVLLVLSDMEFDRCGVNGNVTVFQAMRVAFENAGYQLPRVVFWNLVSRGKNVPVSYHETGTALVSGFSPTILKGVLAGNESTTPLDTVKDCVMTVRYDPVSQALSN